MNPGSSIVDQLIRKLGLHGEEYLKEKTTELLRLLSVKASGTGCTVNEYAKIIICIDLACSVLGVEFDTDIGIKLAGLRKTAYVNSRRTFEKILELNRIVGVKEICLQLNLHEYQKKALQYLEIYKKHINESTDDVDVSHPQYAAMAVYQACKLDQGEKRVKKKLMTLGHLKPQQWIKLEQKWNKLLDEVRKNDSNVTGIRNMKMQQNENDENGKNEKEKERKQTDPEEEEYETWKKRMLDYAYAKLKEMEMNGETSKESTT